MSSSTHINRDGEQDSGKKRQGQLKVFLGYAAGVGKTYRMLEEAQQLKRQSKDIVIGYFEPHARKDTIAKAAGLEPIPRRTIVYKGAEFPEMDTAAILARHPVICVVDELAHTNVPGSDRSKRWEDVQVLLDAGIDIMTNMNIQHLESLNDQIFQIAGVRVRETVPDWFIKCADEVVMVDATTGALLNRLKRGDIYATEKAEKAMENFFKESTLTALRELALRQAALELECREIANTSEGLDTEQSLSGPSSTSPRINTDRILIYVSAHASTSMLIRRGRRMADYLGADCFAVSVAGHNRLSKEERETIEKHLNFARNLHIETRILEGDDAAEAIVDFARRNQITQILLSRCDHKSWDRLFGSDLIPQVVQKARDIRVIIVAERRGSQ